MKRLVIFDFDGTITHKDSLLEFIKFHRGAFNFYLGFGILSPIMIFYLFKIIPNWKAKEAALQYFFKGEDKTSFGAKCRSFSDDVLPSLVRPSAMDAIKNYKLNGDRILVVSASAEDWLLPWCQKYDLELIATRLEIKEERITGKIAGQNCFGEEKKHRLNAYLDIKKYDEIHVYGDSNGDKAILELATHAYYRHFH